MRQIVVRVTVSLKLMLTGRMRMGVFHLAELTYILVVAVCIGEPALLVLKKESPRSKMPRSG